MLRTTEVALHIVNTPIHRRKSLAAFIAGQSLCIVAFNQLHRPEMRFRIFLSHLIVIGHGKNIRV